MEAIRYGRQSARFVLEPKFIKIPSEDIKLLLHWYKPEYFQLGEALFSGATLFATLKFSEYPFINGKMPFISSNLINLALDQCALIHIGMMIKYEIIKLLIVKDKGLQGYMTYDDYNRLVGDEFVTAKIEGKYIRPITPQLEVLVRSDFEGFRKNISRRYVFEFSFCSEPFFIIKALFVFPLNLKHIGG